jgi:hypothetical protein
MAGGGIGDAALISAVIGGGVSAAKGEDPLKGALLGGLLSGATGGIGNLLSPAAPALAGNILAPAASTAVTEAALAPVAETALTGGLSSIPLEGQLSSSALADLTSGIPTPGIGTQMAYGGPGLGVSPETLQPAITEAAQANLTQSPFRDQAVNAAQAANAAQIKPDSSSGLGSLANKFNTLSMPEKLLYGSTAALAAPVVMNMFKGKKEIGGEEEYDGPLKKFKYDPEGYTPLEVAPPTPYQPVYQDYRRYAGGGPIEIMSNANAVGANTGYPMANIQPGAYATPYQQPIPRNVITDSSDTGVNPMNGEMRFVRGGIADLGGYSDYARGGRMLKGPGDGMSDDIPATISGKQPARLANEEFVVPADVVSHLGNGSSEAGAKQLYKMMDRVRHARTGQKKQGKQIKPEKYLA